MHIAYSPIKQQWTTIFGDAPTDIHVGAGVYQTWFNSRTDLVSCLWRCGLGVADNGNVYTINTV